MPSIVLSHIGMETAIPGQFLIIGCHETNAFLGIPTFLRHTQQ